jgi:hypothetical protein
LTILYTWTRPECYYGDLWDLNNLVSCSLSCVLMNLWYNFLTIMYTWTSQNVYGDLWNSNNLLSYSLTIGSWYSLMAEAVIMPLYYINFFFFFIYLFIYFYFFNVSCFFVVGYLIFLCFFVCFRLLHSSVALRYFKQNSRELVSTRHALRSQFH